MLACCTSSIGPDCGHKQALATAIEFGPTSEVARLLATGLGSQSVTVERSLLTGEVIATPVSAASQDLTGVFESLTDSELVRAIGNAASIPSRAKNLEALEQEATRRADVWSTLRGAEWNK